jgi:FtsZ-binding cell division protein ZapB
MRSLEGLESLESIETDTPTIQAPDPPISKITKNQLLCLQIEYNKLKEQTKMFEKEKERLAILNKGLENENRKVKKDLIHCQKRLENKSKDNNELEKQIGNKIDN